MKMKLSTEINTGLKRIPNSLDEGQFDSVVSALSVSLENLTNVSNLVTNLDGAESLKQSYAALFALIVESIRWKESNSSIRSILKDAKLSDARIDKILSLLSKQRIPMQITLEKNTSQFPHIFDVTWKMNYIVKSSYSDIDGKALYFIDFIVGTLKRKSDGSLGFEAENVQVVCTVNQLQSLVAAMKAATKKLEAIADWAK